METENARTTCTTSTVTRISIYWPACGGLRWLAKDSVRKAAVKKCLELPDTLQQNSAVLSMLDARRWRTDALFKTLDSYFELRASNVWSHEKTWVALHQGARCARHNRPHKAPVGVAMGACITDLRRVQCSGFNATISSVECLVGYLRTAQLSYCRHSRCRSKYRRYL